jgi:NADH-quinone oxidoreductase subunit L
VLALAGAGLTAFYMFRLVFMTFYGDFRGGEEAEHHLHESPWTMTLPLQVLAVLSAVGGLLIGFPGVLFHLEGWSFIDRFMAPVVLQAHGDGHHEHAVSLGLEWLLVGLSVAVALAGIAVAYRFYRIDRSWSRPHYLASRFAFVYRLLLNKYWVDELYDATVVNGTIKLAEVLWEVDARVVDGAVNGTRHTTVGSSWLSGIFDLRVVDGLVNLIGNGVRTIGRESRRLQVGYAQGYAMVMVFGAALLLGIFFVVNL